MTVFVRMIRSLEGFWGILQCMRMFALSEPKDGRQLVKLGLFICHIHIFVTTSNAKTNRSRRACKSRD